MEKLHELRERACTALDDIAGSKGLNLMNTDDRRLTHELVEIVKGLDKIEAMGGGYSMGMVRSHHDRDHDGEGYSMRRHRDRMGRYSRAEAKDEMMEHVDEMMAAAPDEHTREIIRDFKAELKRA